MSTDDRSEADEQGPDMYPDEQCPNDTDRDGDCHLCARPGWRCSGSGPVSEEPSPEQIAQALTRIYAAIGTDSVVWDDSEPAAAWCRTYAEALDRWKSGLLHRARFVAASLGIVFEIVLEADDHEICDEAIQAITAGGAGAAAIAWELARAQKRADQA